MYACGCCLFGNKTKSKSEKNSPSQHVRPSLQARKVYSAEDLLRDLRLDDTHPIRKEVKICGYFKNFMRISSEDFEWLANALGPYIGKENTTFRAAISVTTMLAYTLRFLATGDSYHSLSVTFKVGLSTISESIPYICKSIVKVLANQVKVSDNNSRHVYTPPPCFPENDFQIIKCSLMGRVRKIKSMISSVILYFKKSYN